MASRGGGRYTLWFVDAETQRWEWGRKARQQMETAERLGPPQVALAGVDYVKPLIRAGLLPGQANAALTKLGGSVMEKDERSSAKIVVSKSGSRH